MDAQLHLLQTRPDGAPAPEGDARGQAAIEASARWHLDDQTRAVGRRGVAQAREALAVARKHHLEDAA